MTDELKRAAAEKALELVQDGMLVGLGSGSTARYFTEGVGRLISDGMKVRGVPTSRQTAELAAGLGIPIVTELIGKIDLAVDGADEVDPALNLIKGRGGALFREKLVAVTSRRRIIIVDESKVVSALASQHPIPVEVDRFGWRHTAGRLAALGATVQRRMASSASMPNAPFVSDGGNYVLDCWFGPILDAVSIAARIKAITGVIDHGLFVGMTERVYIAGAHGVQMYDRPA